MGPGREFDAIRRLLDRWGPAATGTGDDAAIVGLPGGMRLVVSTDTALEGVHFRRDWLSIEEFAFRSTVGGLSDLAAMGAQPMGLLAAMVVRADALSELDELADGIGGAARLAECPILGGDLVAGERLCLTMTVLGSVERPVMRSGARPGDRIYVTGRLGGPRAALAALGAGRVPAPEHRQRLARPVPRLAEGRWLAEHGATAMIDVSDGLASEARHLAAASRVGLQIELDALPVLSGVDAFQAAGSGEEYELLASSPDELDTRAFHGRFGIPLTRVGTVGNVAPGGVVFLRGGARVDLPGGYDHFSA